MWFTIGFAVACALCAWVLWGQNLLLAAFGALALAGIAEDEERPWPGIILLGCAVGFAWFFFFQTATVVPVLETDGKTLEAELRVRDFSYETEYGTALDGVLTYGDQEYQVRAYLDEKRELQPGDTLSGPFRFRVTTPGGEKEATYHQGRSIFLLLYQKGEVTHTAHGERSWQERVSLFRKDLTDILEALFPVDAMPFAKALLLGDTSDLSYQVDSDLKISGIRHVAAVSGLHVSILFALVSMVTWKRRFLTAAVGFPVLLAFAALAGFTPSVNRSCIMCAMMLLALVLDKSYDGTTALSAAVLVMLAANPLVITDVGFQLSVGSVAGIYLFSDIIRRWLIAQIGGSRWSRGLAGTLSVSLSAMAVTIPLSAWYFGTVSLIGVVTNLLTLWIISVIFYGILGSALLALFWQPGAVVLAKLVSWPIRYVLWVAGTLADFPLAAVYTRNELIILWLMFAYLLLALLMLGKARAGELVCCLVLSLCLCLLPGAMTPWAQEVRFTVLDVGQGQCLLFQSRGKTVMVDCGGDSASSAADRAAQALLSQGITRLDALILTHWDDDHTGGAGKLLTRVNTDLLILPAEPPEEPLPAEKTLYAYEPLSLAWEGTEIRIIPASPQRKGNEKSLCVLFDTENCDILITGDRNFSGEQELLETGQVGTVHVLVAGHHGAKTSVSPQLLEAVKPQAVCISAGEGNSAGHPAPETLERLKNFGCQVYRTDLQGDIIIRR